jgi:hypothetical protein
MSIVDQTNADRVKRADRAGDHHDDAKSTEPFPHGVLPRLVKYALGKVFTVRNGAIAFPIAVLSLVAAAQSIQPDVVITGARAAGVDRPGAARAIISAENLRDREAYDVTLHSEVWCSPSAEPMATPNSGVVTTQTSPRKFLPKGLVSKLTLEASETWGKDVLHARITLRYTDKVGIPYRHQIYLIGTSGQMKESEFPGSDDGKHRISWLWWLW